MSPKRKMRPKVLVGIIILLLVGLATLFLPSTPYMAEVYLDMVNGRLKQVDKILGVETSSQTIETTFSKLVTQHGLEGTPDWQLVGAQGTDYMGKFNYDAYIIKGYFFELDSFLNRSEDNPTTVILEARRLLKAGGDYGLKELVGKLNPPSNMLH